MNIIKIENVGRINKSSNNLVIKPSISRNEKIMVVLSDDDIVNEHSVVKLRGYTISILLIPKKYRNKFELSIAGQLLKFQLDTNYVISYY